MIISNETESIDLVNPVNPLTSEDSSNDDTKNEVGPTENISKEAGKTNMLNNDKRFHVKNFESKINFLHFLILILNAEDFIMWY